MARGWNRSPAGVALGTERTGVSAALWTHDREDVQEVWAEPDPERHVLTVVTAPLRAETYATASSPMPAHTVRTRLH